MKTIILIAVLLLFGSITTAQTWNNPDNYPSITVLQNLTLADNVYDNPMQVNWHFLIKYPAGDKATLLLYYNHSNSQIFSNDADKWKRFNRNTFGIGATIYLK